MSDNWILIALAAVIALGSKSGSSGLGNNNLIGGTGGGIFLPPINTTPPVTGYTGAAPPAPVTGQYFGGATGGLAGGVNATTFYAPVTQRPGFDAGTGQSGQTLGSSTSTVAPPTQTAPTGGGGKVVGTMRQ